MVFNPELLRQEAAQQRALSSNDTSDAEKALYTQNASSSRFQKFYASLGVNGILQDNKFEVSFRVPTIAPIPPLQQSNRQLVDAYNIDPAEKAEFFNKNGVSTQQQKATQTITDTAKANEIDALIRMRAFQVDIPSAALIANQVVRYGIGPSVPYATNVQFTPLTMKFVVDGKGQLYSMFTEWFNTIFNYNIDTRKTTNDLYRVEYRDNYVTDIDIDVYNNYGIKQMNFKINEAYPAQLQETPLSWVIENQMMILTVVFNFSSWQQNKV